MTPYGETHALRLNSNRAMRRWAAAFSAGWALVLAVLIDVNLGVGSLLLLPFYLLLAPYYLFDRALRRGNHRPVAQVGFWITAGIMAAWDVVLALSTFGRI